MGGICGRCWEALSDYMMRPGDTDVERHHRSLMFPVCVLVVIAGTFAAFATGFRPSIWLFALMFLCVGSVFTGVVLMLLRVRLRLTYMVSAIALVCTTGILILDAANSATITLRTWALVVLLMDFLLVLECHPGVQIGIACMTLSALAVERAEAATLFGLYDAVQWNMPNETASVCDCASPPCKQEVGKCLNGWLVAALVFLVDYYVTRGFSVALRTQLDMADATGRVTERITELLAAYATDEARRVVAAEAATIPEGLKMSFEQLLDNLDSYRVFLPDNVLLKAKQARDEEHNAQGSPTAGASYSRPAPGVDAASPTVAVCFTDIQSSTELWESRPQGMYEGLNMHNEVMRRVYAACNGYEVKTIGDSFMVSFDDSMAALRFGLGAQQGLLEGKWPEDLLTHSLCVPMTNASGATVWSGLRVRIGLCHGPVRIEHNPVTRRCDYFGPTVNTAARLEAVLRKGGTVATTQAVLDQIGAGGLQETGDPAVRLVGPQALKGCKEKAEVVSLVPRGLEDRFAVLVEAGFLSLDSVADLVREAPSALSPRRHSQTSRGSRPPSLGRPSMLPSRSQGSIFCGAVPAELDRIKGKTPNVQVSRGSCASAFGMVRVAAMAQRLKEVHGTCIVARCSLMHMTPQADRLSGFVAAASLAADRTQGVVDAVLSACVYVSWNTSRHCAEHTASSRCFMTSPMRAPTHLGAASGALLCGAVAAGRRKYATVVGDSIELAAALAEEAERCNDNVLAVGAVAADCARLGAAHRAQIWLSPSVEEVVWSIVLVAQDSWDFDEHDTSAESASQDAFGEAIPALFARACSAVQGTKEYDTLQRELGQRADHSGAANLLMRMRNGTVRTRLFPKLWTPAHSADQDSRVSHIGSATRPTPPFGRFRQDTGDEAAPLFTSPQLSFATQVGVTRNLTVSSGLVLSDLECSGASSAPEPPTDVR